MGRLYELTVKAHALNTRVVALSWWDETRHTRGKTSASSRGGSFAPRLPAFKKGPGGVLQRQIPPGLEAEIAAAAKLKADAPWQVKIDDQKLDWPGIESLARRDGYGLGGRIEDIIQKQHTTINIGGKKVAAIRMVGYISYPHQGAGGELGERGVSDSMNFTIYRDPARASRLKFKGAW